jgi:tetratricopeptide (TPR) repeat protein
MRAYLLSIFLLVMVAFSLATTLEPWFQSWAGSRTQSDNVLQVALGDSRRMFARHFFTKADAYFHNGFYPSIYDGKEEGGKERHAEDAHGDHSEEECAEDFLGKPKDWIDRFSRNFFASRHTHLGGAGCGDDCCDKAKEGKGHDADCEHEGHEAGHDHSDDGDDEKPAGTGLEREILPWLRLSAEMDPQRVETYVVGAYWLRSRLGKSDEAEQFLREGLRANPRDCEIQFALGQIYYDDRKDTTRARNLLELSLVRWREQEVRKAEPNMLLLGQILNQLAKLEREEKNYPRAIQHYTLLKEISPNKDGIQSWIDELKTNLPPAAVTTPR